ncbi:MAG: hypothetical protein IJB70_06640 [Clostridia bacterium]|nr:hypothetical protein [Clostridia bacterium]
MLDLIKEIYSDDGIEIRDNMVISQMRPHTRPVENLPECASGRVTAEYYFWARYFDKIDDESAKAMVAELKKLQITDRSSAHFGCMRWYREETFITDSNGAFFVLLPMAIAYRLCSHKMTAEEKCDIEELLKNALEWFKKEISGPIFYSNKITSDGAMVALIASITGEGRNESETFWKRWIRFADTRGFGWGENTSDGYIMIMTTALNIAILTVTDENICARIRDKRQILLNYMAFHGGKPMVPSIRTYNFDAIPDYGGAMYKFFVEKQLRTRGGEQISPMMAIIAIESGMDFDKMLAKERVRCERVFDSSVAYTWKGDGIRLGTVSKFPAMKNCYQRDGWGLGWQTMPACALVEDIHVAFLRMRTKIGENMHSHPAVDKHSAFLSNRIFEDGNLVTVNTLSNQQNNLAIVSRSITKLANTAGGIYDEWCIPAGYEKIEKTESNERIWYVVTYNKCALAITNLGGFAHGCKNRGKLDVSLGKSGKFDVISAKLYEGEKKLVFAERLESVWVVAAIENKTEAIEYISKLEISENEWRSDFVPASEFTYLRKIVCTDGTSKAELEVNPDES